MFLTLSVLAINPRGIPLCGGIPLIHIEWIYRGHRYLLTLGEIGVAWNIGPWILK